MTIEYTLEDLPKVAKQVLAYSTKSKILLFDAPMGAGKTTLIKELCKSLEVNDTISSPTYSLVNEYEGNDGPIYHFDFYRINDIEEAYHIGFEEYIDSDAWVFIEWPDMVSDLLPENVITVKINVFDEGKRVLTCE